MIEDTKKYNGHTYSGVQLTACLDGYQQGRIDAINDFVRELLKVKDLNNWNRICSISEMLKEQKNGN